MGLGMGGTMMPMITSALRTLTDHEVARGSTLLNITQQIASSVGVAVISVMLTSQLNASDSPCRRSRRSRTRADRSDRRRGAVATGPGRGGGGVRRHLLGGVGPGAAHLRAGVLPAAQARGDPPARRPGAAMAHWPVRLR